MSSRKDSIIIEVLTILILLAELSVISIDHGQINLPENFGFELIHLSFALHCVAAIAHLTSYFPLCINPYNLEKACLHRLPILTVVGVFASSIVTLLWTTVQANLGIGGFVAGILGGLIACTKLIIIVVNITTSQYEHPSVRGSVSYYGGRIGKDFYY